MTWLFEVVQKDDFLPYHFELYGNILYSNEIKYFESKLLNLFIFELKYIFSNSQSHIYNKLFYLDNIILNNK